MMALETIPFNIQDHLRTPEDRAADPEAALATIGAAGVTVFEGVIAKARGISAFAAETGISRETIYKSFKQGGNPTLSTLAKATRALGLRLAVIPAE